MAITFPCSCGRSIQVADELAGRTVKCSRCQESIRVPDGPGPSPPPTTFSSGGSAERTCLRIVCYLFLGLDLLVSLIQLTERSQAPIQFVNTGVIAAVLLAGLAASTSASASASASVEVHRHRTG